MVDDVIGGLRGGDINTHELIDVATDPDEGPDVRQTARETLQDKLSEANLVELMGGWELHVDFDGVEVTRDLGAVGYLLRAYVELVGPSDEVYTDLATAVGDDLLSHLKAMAEKVADEGVSELGEPELGAG